MEVDHQQAVILYETAVFLAAAVIIVPLFHWLQISPVLGYLAAGIVIGPWGFAAVHTPEATALLAELGILFLLFTVGLELSLDRLKAMRRFALGIGLPQVVVSTAVIALVAWILGLKVPAAIVAGFALAFSSTAIVIQLLTDRGEMTTRHGRASVATLLVQDIAVAPALVLITVMAHKGSGFMLAAGEALGKGVIAIAILIVAGRYILRPLFRLIAATKNQDLFVALTFLVVVLTGAGSQLAGLSGALGAFLGGVLMAETEFRHQIESKVDPFRGLFLGIFFISMGLQLDLGIALAEPFTIAGVVVGLIAFKALVIVVAARAMGFKIGNALKIGFYLAAGGEFAFVILGQAALAGVIEPADSHILRVAAGLSMAISPLLPLVADFIIKQVEVAPARDLLTRQSEEGAVPFEGHVLILGYGRVGSTVAELMRSNDIPYVAIDNGVPRVRAARVKGAKVYVGDAQASDMLKLMGIDKAAAVVITLDSDTSALRTARRVRESWPNVPIFARARNEQHAEDLHRAGVTAIVPETLDASLRLSAMVLESLGRTPDSVAQLMRQARTDYYQRVSEAAAGEVEADTAEGRR